MAIRKRATAIYITMPSISLVENTGIKIGSSARRTDAHSEQTILETIKEKYKEASLKALNPEGEYCIKWIYTERMPCQGDDKLEPYKPCSRITGLRYRSPVS